MGAPLEIIRGPFDVYVADVGEAMTAIGTAVAGSWVKLGTGGANSTSEDGVTFTSTQEFEDVRVDGLTASVKMFRTQEDLSISLTLFDWSLEAVTYGFNENTVTTDAGPPSIKSMPLLRGLTVKEHAVLIRSTSDSSPYLALGEAQIEIYRAVMSGDIETVFSKGQPAGLGLTFRALYDTANSKFAQVVFENA